MVTFVSFYLIMKHYLSLELKVLLFQFCEECHWNFNADCIKFIGHFWWYCQCHSRILQLHERDAFSVFWHHFSFLHSASSCHWRTCSSSFVYSKLFKNYCICIWLVKSTTFQPHGFLLSSPSWLRTWKIDWL